MTPSAQLVLHTHPRLASVRIAARVHAHSTVSHIHAPRTSTQRNPNAGSGAYDDDDDVAAEPTGAPRSVNSPRTTARTQTSRAAVRADADADVPVAAAPRSHKSVSASTRTPAARPAAATYDDDDEDAAAMVRICVSLLRNFESASPHDALIRSS